MSDFTENQFYPSTEYICLNCASLSGRMCKRITEDADFGKKKSSFQKKLILSFSRTNMIVYTLEQRWEILRDYFENRRRGLVCSVSTYQAQKHGFVSQVSHQKNEIWKIFLRRLPLNRFLAKTLRLNKIAMKKFLKNLSFGINVKL